MLPDDSPIGRDVKAEAKDPFGNITGNPSMANLMADPLGTEIVAGLTGPISAQGLPTDTENVMGQPPQVNFDGGGGGATPMPTPSDDDSPEVKEADGLMSIFDRAKALVARNWKWVFAGAGVVIVGGVMLKRKK
tara:strand:- start:75 stop:476 length:402 start_codon:yes stop_codon:yes gene_type:complete